MDSRYDSTKDTNKHRSKVQAIIEEFVIRLRWRAQQHDISKLESPEKELFDKYSPLLSSVEYGSDEYMGYLAEMDKALQHHYENNSHHPEHHEEGINGMSLLDVVEMFCDWKAASMRHKNGDILGSLKQNRDRFDLSDQLYLILMNTAREMDF